MKYTAEEQILSIADTNKFPDRLTAHEQWVVADTSGLKKKPRAPWMTAGRGSWSDAESHVDFEQAKRAAERREDHEVGFVFTEDDPFVFIDFDDARDPETGHIDPSVAEIIDRADSYADVSMSGTGLHLIVCGSLPEETKTIQSPVGSDGASIEVYDQKRFAVMTGRQLGETPRDCHDNQALIDELAAEYRTIHENTPDAALDEPTRSQNEVAQIETTTDPDVVWDAVRHTTSSDLRLKSEVTEERADGTKSRDPSWERSESGTRLGEFDDGFVYRDGMVGLDCLQLVALEERILRDLHDYPKGEDYFEAVDALRNRGAHIPEYHPVDGGDPERSFELPTVAGLPDCSLTNIRERARENGLVWPSTGEVRDRLDARLRDQLRQASSCVINAPTASGKTHAVATTAWTDEPELTGEGPVLHLSKTQMARNEAYQTSQQAGVDAVQLRAGEEQCPVTAGNYDDGNVRGNEPLDHLVPNELSVSEWMRRQTHEKQIPHGRAHNQLNQRRKREYDQPLPCSRDGECASTTQWDRIDLSEDFEKQDLPDVIHATHQFARVAGLVAGANVVFDEQPEFTLDVDDERLQRAVGSFLREVDAPQSTWEDFVAVALDGDRMIPRHELQEAVEADPSSDWYFNDSAAHSYAPAIARALVDAEQVGNQRYAGQARHQPFYRGRDDEQNGIEQVSVVLDERYEFELVKPVPPLLDARCVIGLDAHPTLARWQMDTLPSMTIERVLSSDERQNWRRFERGLLVIQVGDSDRPLTQLGNFSESKAEGLVGELTIQAPDLQTAITSKAAEDRVEKLLPESDRRISVLHYGEELSRNEFSGEDVGLLVGCIDPGDDSILDWLALCDGEATPARSDEACGECDGSGCYDCLETGSRRAKGREFDGSDAALANTLLASVRERHVAQGVGRYAREADQPDEPTVVFVWTAAILDELVDITIPDVRALTETQRAVVQHVEQSSEPVTTRSIANALDIRKETARKTLLKLVNLGSVTVDEGAGKDGAHLYEVEREIGGFLQLDDGGSAD